MGISAIASSMNLSTFAATCFLLAHLSDAAVDTSKFPPALEVHETTFRNDLHGLKMALIEEPDSVNAVTLANLTALHMATKHAELVDALLAAGAKVDAVDINHETPLMVAARTNYPDIVETLIKKGADCGMRRNDGYTALMLAVQNTACTVIVELLKCKADPNMVGPGLYSALTMAAADGNHACLAELIRKDSTTGKSRVVLDEPNEGGQTALMISANNNFPKGVALLLEHGALARIQDDNGTTPLMHAIKGDNKEGLELLLKDEAGLKSIDVPDEGGATALMHAAAYKGQNSRVFVSMLLEKGANPNPSGKIIGVPGDWMNALLISSIRENIHNVRSLIDAGADVAPSNNHGYTALHVASLSSFVPGVQALLEAGTPQETTEIVEGFTAFGIAVEHQKRAVIDTFREFNGEDFSAEEEVVQTLTHETFAAAVDGRAAIVFFFAPSCKYSVALHPVWEELARSVKSLGLDIVVAKVEGTSVDIMSTHKISTYPTIQFFTKDNPVGNQWKGSRFYDALLHVIETYVDADPATDFSMEQGFNGTIPPRPSAAQKADL